MKPSRWSFLELNSILWAVNHIFFCFTPHTILIVKQHKINELQKSILMEEIQKNIEWYLLQILFFIIRLVAYSFVIHDILTFLNFKNLIAYSILYLSGYGCIYLFVSKFYGALFRKYKYSFLIGSSIILIIAGFIRVSIWI